MIDEKWWQKEIFYQVYPRSFKDSNQDGVGDLQGIIAKLDYIQSLGVSTIWISPIYKSPMADMGYDIANYEAIDPIFGTMADFDQLLVESKKRNLKIIMDLVVNHTSDEHPWFLQALKDKNSPYRQFYIFKTTQNGEKPNNWRAIFGGSTWTEVENEPGTYFFHTFLPKQPDLNWENPMLRQAIYKMINWWLDKGIAGFRIDAITHIKKDLDWESLPADGEDGLVNCCKKGQNRPGIDLFLQELKAQTFAKYDIVTIGEAYGLEGKDLPRFIGPDGFFSMVFDFSYLNIEVKDANEWYLGRSNWTIKDLKKTIFANQKMIQAAKGITTNVLENHDQPRVLSRLIADPKNQTPIAAKALALMYYFLPGVPMIYQGQELGMKNFKRSSIDQFNDVSSINNYNMALREGLTPAEALDCVNLKSRDNARTPMQWDDSIYGGFSTVQPWLEMGNDRVGINVVQEEQDPNSVLNFYRALGTIYHQSAYHDLLLHGKLKPLKNVPNEVIAYQRRHQKIVFTVVVNLCDQKRKIKKPVGAIKINNLETAEIQNNDLILQPFQAVLFVSDHL